MNYATIADAFKTLNEHGAEYLVLRNYDNLQSPEMYMDGHGDIDMLCRDSQEVANLLGAGIDRKDKPPFRGDGTHYYIYVDGKYVSMDLRYVGDDYYCAAWQRDMLAKRVKHECFYVMDDENYFFSLIYHAVLQKRSLSEEYRQRLFGMAARLGISPDTPDEKGLVRLLDDFMRRMGYVYRYSSDKLVPMRFHVVDRTLVSRNARNFWAHWAFDGKVKLIDWLFRLKHIIPIDL